MVRRIAVLLSLAVTRAAISSESCVEDGEAGLRKGIERLASPDLDGRAAGSEGDALARAFVAERFRCLGLEPGGKSGRYEQPFVAGGKATANVVGYVKGSDATVGSEIILVGAHHDHLGGGFLGANDNASGVVALLAIAQAVRQHGPPRRTLAFVTFGAEEAGLLGSAELVAHPPAALPLDRVVEVVNLDMVGSYASRDVVYAFGTFPGLPSRTILGALRHPRLHVGLGGHSVRGDQVAFCRRGIPYTFFWTPDTRCYHERCDTAERIDYAHMADIAALAGDLVEHLANDDIDLIESKRRRGCGASGGTNPPGGIQFVHADHDR